MNAELKKVKIARFMSEETTAFTAELWLDGKMAAFVKNDGQGGDNHPAFIERGMAQPFYDYCATMTWTYDGETYTHNYDSYIGELLEQYEQHQWSKRQCKAKTLFRLKGDPAGQYHVIKHVFDDTMAEIIRRKEGDQLDYILNERIAI
jgi:hypothetical protein